MLTLAGMFCVRLSLAQLEIPFDEASPDAAPTPEPAELAEEQARIRQITQEMQRRTSRFEERNSEDAPPGKEYYERVYQRLLAAPEEVRVKILLKDASLLIGVLENQVFDVTNPVGRFPVEWGEVTRLEAGAEGVSLKLKGNDRISGQLALDLLHVQRDDASFIRIPLEDVAELMVIPEAP
jgi:hypothetical protein